MTFFGEHFTVRFFATWISYVLNQFFWAKRLKNLPNKVKFSSEYDQIICGGEGGGGQFLKINSPPDLDPDPNVQEETGVDEDGEPVQQPKHKMPKRGGKFMEGVPGVRLFITQPKLATIQKKVQKICEWSKGN